MSSIIEKNLLDAIAFFENLEGHRLVLLNKYFDCDVRFYDPFHDCEGLDHLRYAMELRFSKPGARIKFRHHSFMDEATVLLRWDFLYSEKKKKHCISGASEWMFDKKGMIVSWEDFWNPVPNFYEKLPVSGSLIKSAKKKFSAI